MPSESNSSHHDLQCKIEASEKKRCWCMACSGALKSVSTVTITAADSRTLRYAWRGIGNRGEQLLSELQERYTLRLCFWCLHSVQTSYQRR